MKEEGRGILQGVIEQIERILRYRESGHWTRIAEQTDPNDEELLTETLVSMDITGRTTIIVVGTTLQLLLGKHIFIPSPSVVTRGWAFWRRRLATKKEAEAIVAAVTRCYQAQAWKELRSGYLEGVEDAKLLRLMASVLERLDSSIRQLRDDLKQILDAAMEE